MIIAGAIRDLLRPSPRLELPAWLKRNVRFQRGPIVGPLDLVNSPWIKEPLEQLKNPAIREIIAACAVQSAKTVLLEAAAMYSVAEAGDDMAIYCQTDEHSQVFLDKRFQHRLMACEPVANLLTNGARSIQKASVDFVHMTLYVRGATNIHGLQSISVRYVFGDEVAYWPHGHMDESRKRTTSYDSRNSKRIYISTPLDSSGEFYGAYMSGTQSEWTCKCPDCSAEWQMRLANLKWDAERAKLPDGTYDYAILTPTVRYVCEECKSELPDTLKVRKALSQSGFYIRQNPNPDPSIVSYHWNALAVPWVAWASIATEFLKAEYAKKQGDLAPLSELIRKRLGEFWDLREFSLEETNLASGFKMLDSWDDEHRRYMTVDVQRDYYRVVTRLWALDGRSRLFLAAECLTWQEIEELQAAHSVTARRVFVDCGWERAQGDVYRQCAKNGWIAVKGDKTPFFTWFFIDPRSKKKVSVKRPYSKMEPIDSGVGLSRRGGRAERRADRANRIVFSSDHIGQILHRLKAGQGAKWEIASDAPKFYFTEIANEVFVVEKDKRTGKRKPFFKELGGCHALDCEKMQVLAAYIEKILGREEIEIEEDDGKNH